MKNDCALMNHERIHLKQQLELLILPFFLLYSFEFIFRLYQYKHWKTAYKNISFEREAYYNEKNLEYLETRSFWAFLSYYNA